MKSQSLLKNLTYWNRKLHIHIGLLLLLFIWLFSFSGLLLNHSQWKFASFWDEREEKLTQTPVIIPANLDSVRIINNLMEQLNLKGEVSEVKMSADSIDFRVSFPGTIRNLHIDFRKAICFQKEIHFNFWGKIRTLHTFNGANKANPNIEPNWVITHIWRFSMDGIAIGLIFLCISSWVMWFKIRKEYAWGSIVLALGFLGAIYFVFLLRML